MSEVDHPLVWSAKDQMIVCGILCHGYLEFSVTESCLLQCKVYKRVGGDFLESFVNKLPLSRLEASTVTQAQPLGRTHC